MDVVQDLFLNQMLNIVKGFKIFIMIYHLYQKEQKLKNATSLYDSNDYVAHKKTLKQALNDELKGKKVHRLIQFNQKFI